MNRVGGLCPDGHRVARDEKFCRTCGVALNPTPSSTSLPPPTGPPVALPPPSNPRISASLPTEPPETLPEPREMEARTQTPRRGWSWIAISLGLIAILSVGLFAFAFNRDKDPVVCESGVKWRQQPTPRIDGTAISNGVAEAGIIWGGALIGFPSREEASAMGHMNDFVVVSEREFNSIDRVPREGLLFRERSIPGRPGRYYYSAGGAVYEVSDPNAVRALGIAPSDAIAIAINGLDGARRIPPTGTLLRADGRETTWVVDGGGRRRAENVCDGARTVVLPSDRNVLAGIPTIPEYPG